MKIFVAGGGGFIGKNVAQTLEDQGHEVYKSSRISTDDSVIAVDLLDKIQIESVLRQLKPEVIINCAGIVGADKDFEDNVRISRNLIESVASTGLNLYRFVACGSAGEYGAVKKEDWPVTEDMPLNATNPYPLSKIAEEKAVHELSEEYKIDTVVARIFNPIGVGMPEKFLITNLMKQMSKVKTGEIDTISVGRADALRDYIDINDLSRALAILATHTHKYEVYNVGTGIATSTESLVESILEESNLPKIPIHEVNSEPEQSVASQADISRLKDEFDWAPEVSIRQTIRGIINNESSK